jgi:hypothetical protein
VSRQQYAWQPVDCPFCHRRKAILVPVEEEELRKAKRQGPRRKECDDCYCSSLSKGAAEAYLKWRDAVCPE